MANEDVPERIWILEDDVKLHLPLVSLVNPLRRDAIECVRSRPTASLEVVAREVMIRLRETGYFADELWEHPAFDENDVVRHILATLTSYDLFAGQRDSEEGRKDLAGVTAESERQER